MPENIRVLNNIFVELPEKDIFLRLGGNIFKTQLSGPEKSGLRKISAAALALCRPCGRYALRRIAHADAGNGEVTFTDGTKLFPGKDFTKLLSGANALWLGAVTIGRELTEARDTLPNVSEKAVYDAVGSEIADSAMAALQKLAANELLRQGLSLSRRRFSPGYGDMPLALQSFFYETLQMEQMGITLDENFFMTPEKSVTAFIPATTIQGNTEYETR